MLTGINFGRGLPRALGLRGVPVASVGNLDTYGLFPDLQDEVLKKSALATFNKMYGGAAGRDVVFDYLGQTGADVLKGADVLRQAPAQYSSTVSYPDNPVAHNLKAIAQVLLADIGTPHLLHHPRQLRHAFRRVADARAVVGTRRQLRG